MEHNEPFLINGVRVLGPHELDLLAGHIFNDELRTIFESFIAFYRAMYTAIYKGFEGCVEN